MKRERKRKISYVRIRRRLYESRYLYLLLLPALVYFAVFHYAPLYGVQIAFKDFSARAGISGSRFIGLEHFRRFFNSYYFSRMVKNTVVLSVYNIIFAFPFPIFLALLFNELSRPKVKKIVQTISYAPHFISTVVMVGILNLFFNQGTGLLNILLRNAGKEAMPFLTDPDAYRPLYVLSGIWQHAGWNAIIYVAALSAVDQELIEAAQIDGATRLQRIIHINIPCIIPTAVVLFILEMGRLMNIGFEKAYLLQNAMNIEKSQVIPTFVYEAGLIKNDYGYSTAISLFNNVINVVLLLTFNQIAKKLTEESLF